MATPSEIRAGIGRGLTPAAAIDSAELDAALEPRARLWLSKFSGTVQQPQDYLSRIGGEIDPHPLDPRSAAEKAAELAPRAAKAGGESDRA